MIVYNAGNIDHNSRFILSCVIGFVVAVVLGICYGAVQSLVRIEMEIMYIFIGWVIAKTMREIGHGVTKKYSILGGILAAVAIIVGDIVTCYGLPMLFTVLFHPSMWLMTFRVMILSKLSSIWGLLGVMFRAAGIYVGYSESRIF